MDSRYKEFPYAKLGLMISRLRLARGLSKKELAKSLNVHSSYIYMIERGRRRPSSAVLRKLSESLNVPYEELVSAAGISKRVEKGKVSELKQEIKSLKRQVARLTRKLDRIARREAKKLEKRATMPALPVYCVLPVDVPTWKNAVNSGGIGRLRIAPKDFRGDQDAFAVRVGDDSMELDGVLRGDTVVISPATEIKEGDMALVMVLNEGVSLRKVYYEGRTTLLGYGTNKYPPKAFDGPNGLHLIGKAVYVTRKLR